MPLCKRMWSIAMKSVLAMMNLQDVSMYDSDLDGSSGMFEA